MPGPHLGMTYCGSPGQATKIGEGVDRTTHLGPRSALLSRRSRLSLGSLETRNQARIRGDGTNQQGEGWSPTAISRLGGGSERWQRGQEAGRELGG